jgi:protease-4
VRPKQDLAARFGHDDGVPRLVPVESYRRAAGKRGRSGRAVAVVHAHGLILPGKNSFNPGLGSILGAATVMRDLQAAAEDDNIAAIVLRIDSPGGEIIASDDIGRAVERAKLQKPVVVSMVDVAASGGYMAAYRASRIVALPTTITGSIGSITGKMNARGLYDKLGLSKDFVTRGKYPFLYSDYHNWSAAEESLVVAQHWEDYRRWIEDIARHRELTPAEVDSLARGRVWTGHQALERKLLDEIGDGERAIQIAREMAGLPATTAPRVVHYPKEMSLFEALLEERGPLLAAALQRWWRDSTPGPGLAWGVLDFEMMR